ncbi:DUF4267 domain-containing protein [Lichenifustis flavocetrariae]|uniref:DUF4267 domain-containing protein n=1 Tax=Lichenifustis flavocetrariae TaxID=2949735 RepID=A0AA42CMH8_9HYPH|nr:DUF4267 domain-containing protein [Lichenifustis flavocetrariae]MCW6508360.1 DUF4267 domain-containing protein [Lichenifustis flavocetrariae]
MTQDHLLIQIGYVLSGLIAAAILFLGARFWLAPSIASAGFGIAESPPASTGFNAWLSVKGTRDLAACLFVILLIASGSPRLLGEFMLIASLIAFGDMVSVLRSGGSRALAFGMHGMTGLVIVATGACLIIGAR